MKKLFATLLLLNGIESAPAQITQEWVARYNGPGNNSDFANAIAVDGAGNIYVTGQSGGIGTKNDYATIKYNSSGIQEWAARYDGPGNAYAYSLAVDDSGNVYVTGCSGGIGTEGDYATIKYNSSGVQQWVARYNGPGNWDDCARSLAVDGSGNVFVTGYSYGNGTVDYATIKYNSSGSQEWVARYNGPGNNGDFANSLAVDGSGNVYVTGYSQGSGTNDDYATIKYNSSGNQQWVARYNGPPGNNGDAANSLAVDGSGNVYVTGESRGNDGVYDYATIKYNSSGDSVWVERYDGSNRGSLAISIAVDGSGNVYVTGKNQEIGIAAYDYATIKYNSSGNSVWVARYDGPGNYSDDVASSIAVDGSGNVYVTGRSGGSETYDYATIKYSSSGDSVWVARYNGTGNGIDEASSIAVDGSGNVYVTGNSSIQYSQGSYDILTIKYHQSNPLIPLIKVNLKVLFEGLYSSLFNMLARKDTLTVYLANATSPFAIIDSSKSVIDSLNFSGVFTFQNAPSGIYYLIVKHFNSIVTWSKAGGTYFSRDFSTHSYDFTTSASQAYGNNLKLKGGKYCIVSGDVFQDGFIDGSDLLVIDNDAYTFATGRFLPSDLNGDGFTDAQDMLIADNNRSREVIRP